MSKFFLRSRRWVGWAMVRGCFHQEGRTQQSSSGQCSSGQRAIYQWFSRKTFAFWDKAEGFCERTDSARPRIQSFVNIKENSSLLKGRKYLSIIKDLLTVSWTKSFEGQSLLLPAMFLLLINLMSLWTLFCQCIMTNLLPSWISGTVTPYWKFLRKNGECKTKSTWGISASTVAPAVSHHGNCHPHPHTVQWLKPTILAFWILAQVIDTAL